MQDRHEHIPNTPYTKCKSPINKNKVQSLKTERESKHVPNEHVVYNIYNLTDIHVNLSIIPYINHTDPITFKKYTKIHKLNIVQQNLKNEKDQMKPSSRLYTPYNFNTSTIVYNLHMIYRFDHETPSLLLIHGIGSNYCLPNLTHMSTFQWTIITNIDVSYYS